MAYERKMSTPPMLLMVYGLLYVLLQSIVTIFTLAVERAFDVNFFVYAWIVTLSRRE